MTTESAINQQSTSRKKGQFVLALAVGAALALLSWQLGVLDGSTDIFGGLTGSAASASNPSAFVAVGLAFVIGASMISLRAKGMDITHCARSAHFCQLRLELLMNFRVFIGELNQRAPPSGGLSAEPRFICLSHDAPPGPAPWFDSELATLHVPGVEMLMEPTVGRSPQTPRFQIDLDSLVVAVKGPQQVVPLSLKHEQLSAWPVIVGRPVRPHRIRADMGAQHLLGHFKLHEPRLRGALDSTIKTLRIPENEGGDVGDEIHHEFVKPDAGGVLCEVVFISRIEAIYKGKVVFKDEVEIMENIHHERSGGEGDIADRLTPAPIKMLV